MHVESENITNSFQAVMLHSSKEMNLLVVGG